LDEIVLKLPREACWHSVAYLVLAGLAARLELTVENLEDWQLALTELLGRTSPDGRLELVFRASPEQLEARFGPADEQILTELERQEAGVGLRRVLSTLTDSVEVETTGGARWIVLRKAIVHPDGAS
jgi:anti-sigma regulatory factor (Ser/Thr protein kinase)